MKKLMLITGFSLLMVFNSCSTNGGNNNGDKSGTVTEGTVTHMTADMFRKLVWDYQKDPNNFSYKGELPCIIDFYADWCRPCKMVAPILEDLAKEYKGKIRVYKVNTDQEKELAGIFKISSIPAILLVPKQGQPAIAVGASPKESYVQAIHEVLKVK